MIKADDNTDVITDPSVDVSDTVIDNSNEIIEIIE